MYGLPSGLLNSVPFVCISIHMPVNYCDYCQVLRLKALSPSNCSSFSRFFGYSWFFVIICEIEVQIFPFSKNIVEFS